MELRQLLAALWRRRMVVLGVFAGTFFTIVVGTLLVKSSYDSTAQVLIRKSAPAASLLNALGVTAPSAAFSDTDRADYLALATLRPVLENVVVRTRLTRVKVRSAFFRMAPFLKPAFRAVGVDVDKTDEKMKYDELISTPLVGYVYPIPHLKVEQVESSDLISFKATSPDPAQAAQIANAAAQAFIESEVQLIRSDFASSREFLAANISRARATYDAATQGVKNYKETAGTYDVDTETTTLIEKVFELRKAIDDGATTTEKTKSLMREIETRLVTMPKYQKESEQIKANEMINSLKISLRDLYLSLAETRSKYTSEHPVVTDYENMIAEAKELLRGEMERVFSSESIAIDTTYKDYTSRLTSAYIDLVTNECQNAAYKLQLEKYQGELARIPEKSARLSQLDVAVSTSEDVYTDVRKLLTQIEIAEAIAVSNIAQVQSAVAPDRSDSKHKTPSLLLNTVIALFLGTVFGVGAGLLAEYVDDSVSDPRDVESEPGCALLGSIRTRKKIAPVVTQLDRADPLREPFTALRTALYLSMRERPFRSFAVVSPEAGEGKSLVATHLAIALAREGRRVLLVDANLRRPAIAKFFEVPATVGVASLLSAPEQTDTLAQPSGVESLLVVTAGPEPADPLGLVDSPRLREFIENARASYEFVIVDTPPLLQASEALPIAAWADNVVLVVSAGKTPKPAFRNSVALLTRAGVHLAGVVLNRADDAAAL